MDRPGLGARGHWLTAQAQDLVADQTVVQVDSEATVEEACDALIQHKIQSVPLYDARSHSYVGMFDLHDLSTYILAKRDAAEAQPPGVERSGSSPLLRQATGGESGAGGGGGGGARMGASDTVGRLSDRSHLNPFYSVVPETTVAQVAQVFAKGAHRVAVMQDERTIRGILSQAGMVRYFFERSGDAAGATEAEERLLDATLDSLGLVSRDVVCVTPEMPVLRALSLFENWHISSLALVDDERRLLGNLSLTDVKYLARKPRLLHAKCMELVQAARYQQGVIDGQDRAAVFSVRPEATLRYVLAKLIATGAHRMWITEPPASGSADSVPASVSTTPG
ncbi:cell separation during budding, partial [Coemansia nantahalensis]